MKDNAKLVNLYHPFHENRKKENEKKDRKWGFQFFKCILVADVFLLLTILCH